MKQVVKGTCKWGEFPRSQCVLIPRHNFQGGEDEETPVGYLTEPFRGHEAGTVFFTDHLGPEFYLEPVDWERIDRETTVFFLSARIPTIGELVGAVKDHRNPDLTFEF